ncbi:hypothetical protein HZH66_009840 [Vespula vulgaris]|uniref:Uncharacterized protein n=1 Tax=Vespula vulgaris TaxID=7454 RepID=A0A834JNQ9_VESVU|nr:hypothetical protein HZH66_009840 [Vespula vulgaris]
MNRMRDEREGGGDEEEEEEEEEKVVVAAVTRNTVDVISSLIRTLSITNKSSTNEELLRDIRLATIKRRRKSDLRGARKTAKRVLLRVAFLDEAAGGGRLQNIDMENSGDGHGNCHWSDFIGFLVEAFGIGTATARSRDKTGIVFADQFSFTFVEEASER